MTSELSGFQDFKPKRTFAFSSQGLTLKIASNSDDLKEVFKLRHQVFMEEKLGRTNRDSLEFDAFDHRADHLMIVDEETEQVVGTYRLIHSDFSSIFYSQQEFELDGFLALEGSKLELGRACTRAEYRMGQAIDILWQGLARYIRETQTRYLFGCSSLQSTDPQQVFSVAKSLESRGSLNLSLGIRPTEPFAFKEASAHFEKASVNPKVLRSLPPLLRSYLHAGSQVYGYPALDEEFACSDFFTILDLTKLNKKFNEHYRPLG